MDKEKDIAILRMFKDGDGDWRDALIIFPEVPATNDEYACLSLGWDGHGATNRGVISRTEPLSPNSAEGKYILALAKKAGWNPKVVERWSQEYDRVRHAALRAMGR